jgi:hypothetical protein
MGNEHETVATRIARAKELLRTAKFACMATTNEDGSPHATPFYLIPDERFGRVYFGSHPESLHSKNVARTGQLFVVVYDKAEKGGLYMKAVNGSELSGKALAEGLAAHNATRARDGMAPLKQEYYEGGNPQRMYGADLVAFWVNVVQRDENGYISKEYRHEINASDLLEGDAVL